MRRFSFFVDSGTRWILLSVVLAAILWVQLNIYAAIPAGLFSLLLMRFYYDPDRQLPSHPLGVMSPVDGTVEHVGLFHDPFLDRQVQRIRIQSDLLGVYHARSPTEGKMMEHWPMLSEDKQGYTRRHTKGVLWIKTDEADEVIVVVRNRFSWGHTRCNVQAGERVGQGRRCGRFPITSKIDILIAEGSYIEAEVGQRVKAGVDQVATFNHDLEPEKTDD